MLFNAYAIAIRRFMNNREWLMAMEIAGQALLDLPTQAIVSKVFWRFLVKSFMGSNAITVEILNRLDEFKRLVSRRVPPRYLVFEKK